MTADGTIELAATPELARPKLHGASADELEFLLGALCERHGLFRVRAGHGVRTSLFRTRSGAPRVLFVTNTRHSQVVARVELGRWGSGLSRAVDSLDGSVFHASVDSLEVPLSPQSVRMLELS
jgi:hypothetical protein